MNNRISRPFRAARRGKRTGVIALVGAAALVAVGLAGCSSGASSSGSTAAANQTLKIGFSAEPPGFKTGVDQGSANKQLLTLVRRGLLAYGPKGDVVPALASSFKVSDDGLSYTFTLRDKLAFSDGKTLTSADVKRTFQYLADPANGAADQVTFANITSIDTPDAKTVTPTLAKPQT
ncbi:MAG TPA: ABC transporter substrate-binding protein, partial [Vicinamibacterales bacterium]|nr:ABC transporter substrate-binding protein [Vicinamibacterales bacterium]